MQQLNKLKGKIIVSPLASAPGWNITTRLWAFFGVMEAGLREIEIISVLYTSCVSVISYNIHYVFISPISYRSAIHHKILHISLVYARIPYFFMASSCIRGTVSKNFNIMINPDLIATSDPSLILSGTNPAGVFLVTYFQGLKLFSLGTLFISHYA